MQFFTDTGVAVDSSPGQNMAKVRDNYLVSSLHFKNTDDIAKDANPDIIWEVTDGVYSTDKYSIYENVACIPGGNSIILKTPIELISRAFTIDFWMKCGITDTIKDISNQEDVISAINKNIKIDIYSSNDLDEPFLSLYYNGIRRVREYYVEGEPGGEKITYFAYAPNSSTVDWYNIINNNIDEMHHFSISYSLGDISYIEQDSTRIVSLWLDGLLENSENGLNVAYNGDMEYIIIKMENTSTNNDNMYISNFRIWDGVILHKPDDILNKRGYDFERNFVNDLEEMKSVARKKLSYRNLLKNSDLEFYKPRVAPISGYTMQYPGIRTNSTADLLFFQFPADDLYKNEGSLNNISLVKGGTGCTTSNFTRITNSTSNYYTIYGNTIRLPSLLYINFSSQPTLTSTKSERKRVKHYHSGGSVYSSSGNYDWVWRTTTYYNKYSNASSICLQSNIAIPLQDISMFTFEYFTGMYAYSTIGGRISYTDVNFLNSNGTANSASGINHVAYTYDGLDLKKYFNGKLTETIENWENTTARQLKLCNINCAFSNTGYSTSSNVSLGTSYCYPVLGYVRLTNRILYEDSFDPFIILAYGGSSIMDYLKSKNENSSDTSLMLHYPVANPTTAYDICQSTKADVKFKPLYDTTLCVDYENIICQVVSCPEEYKNQFAVFSAMEEAEQKIKFQVDKMKEHSSYQIDFWVFLQINKETDEYENIIEIAFTSAKVYLMANSNGSLKVKYGDITPISDDVLTNGQEFTYNYNFQNKWSHIVFNVIMSYTIRISIDGIDIEFPGMECSGSIRQIFLDLGKRRTGSMTKYFIGLNAKYT